MLTDSGNAWTHPWSVKEDYVKRENKNYVFIGRCNLASIDGGIAINDFPSEQILKAAAGPAEAFLLRRREREKSYQEWQWCSTLKDEN